METVEMIKVVSLLGRRKLLFAYPIIRWQAQMA
jgi:hypothetical protein